MPPLCRTRVCERVKKKERQDFLIAVLEFKNMKSLCLRLVGKFVIWEHFLNGHLLYKTGKKFVSEILEQCSIHVTAKWISARYVEFCFFASAFQLKG